MRISKVFVLGAIVGAGVMWLWGRQVQECLQESTRGLRTRAARGVRAVDETAGQVLDRGGNALHRVDELLQSTKEHVSEVLRVGEEAIRPAPAAESGRP